MINLLDIDGFDWDDGNQDKNTLKHKVTNKECEEIFKNKPLIVNYDNVHSTSEEGRFQVLGQTSFKRKLFISYTIRNNKIRIISARDMSIKERKKFKDEEIEKRNS